MLLTACELFRVRLDVFRTLKATDSNRFMLSPDNSTL